MSGLLPVASFAADKGWIEAEKFKEIFREQYKKAFPDFDLEKVFWQILYTEGIYLSINVIYRISDVWTGLTANLPYLFGGSSSVILNPDDPVPEDLMIEIEAACTEETGQSEGNKEWGACVLRKVQEEGYTVSGNTMLEDLLKKVFVDYAPLVIMGIPLLFTLLEANNAKKKRRAKRLLK